jgi:tetratricopeptide (TPR) repeat protein
LPAQATFCFREAVTRNPEEPFAWSSLIRSFQARRMRDAQSSLRPDQAVEVQAADEPGVSHVAEHAGSDGGRMSPELLMAQMPQAIPHDRESLSAAIFALLADGRPCAAAGLFESCEDRAIDADWNTCDRVAATLLHLGEPARALRIWERAANPPSPALRAARVATAALAQLDYKTAESGYRSALELDPGLTEAWFGLALIHLQRGDAENALAAARQARRGALTFAQDEFLQTVESLAAPYVRIDK